MTEEKKLDLLLKHYRKMMVDHDDGNHTKLNAVSQKIIAANHDHSAFRRYKNRLKADGLIEIDNKDDGGDGRWMSSHLGITYSYRVEKWKIIILKSLQLSATMAIALGTIVAGVYYGVSLWTCLCK